MKTPFHSLFPLLRPLPAVVFLSFAGQAALLAQTNGTWTLDGSGNWSTPANWAGGNVASGVGAIADFSTLDITGDHLVTIDTPFVIGSLLAQDATTPSNNWALGGAGPLTLDNGGNQPVLDVINQALAISAPLDGTNGFSKTGAGTLNLSGASTYTGNTTLADGILQTSGGNDRLPTATTLAFIGTAGALDLTTTSQTMAGLTVPNGLATSYTISGSSLTLNGAVNLQFGPGGTTAEPVRPGHSITMDAAALSSFSYTAPGNIFRVGLKAGTQNNGALTNVATVTLADQNAITASTLAVGDVAANNTGGTSTLRLGRLNALNVGAINIGASGRSNTNFLFNPGSTDPSVTIRNTDGTSAVTSWRVGQVANFNANTWTDVVDLSAGTVDALVTNLTVGTADIQSQTGRGGTENASFTLGAGSLQTTTLLLGRISGTATATINSAMAANGTFNLNHASGTVKADTLTLAENTTLAGGTVAGTRRVSGIFNLTAGTLEATTIQLGPQTGNATATAAINWTDGTIRNLSDSGLAINSVPFNLLAGNHVFDATGSAAITLDATSNVSGPGGLTKTGTGTLSLQGANTYTGPTDAQAGTLAISNSFPNGSAFTVDAAATLELANVTIVGLPALDIDGSLKLTGPVAIGAPLSAVPGTFANLLQYGSITGAANLKHNYRNASITVGTTATDLSVAAGLPLTWTGDGGNSWDLNTTSNWKDASNNPQTFFWADSVTFDSAGSGTPNVNLTAEMQPFAVTVNAASVDYVFSGPGSIAGMTGLTKNGAAKLTIETNNTNTGTSTINAGTLEIGSGTTTGSPGNGAIVNNAALVFNRSNNITVANEISGTGSVTKVGSGTLTLSGSNSYSGGTFFEGNGVLALTNASAAGSGTINIASTQTTTAGTFTLNGGIDVANPIQIDSSTGRNTINSLGAVGNTLSGNITIDNTSTFAIVINNSSAVGLGTTFTVGGATPNSTTIAAPTYENVISFRTSSTGNFGVLNSRIDAPNATVNANNNGSWTFNSTGSTWAQTSWNNACGFILGATDALATGAFLNFAGTATGYLDLNGKNQTVAGLAGGNSNATNIKNTGAADSTLALAGLITDRSFSGIIADGPTNRISLVMNDSSGFTQTLSGVNGYTGDTTVSAGTLSLATVNAANEASTVNIAETGATLDLTFSGTDTVDKLFIGTTQMAAGEYGAVGSAAPVIGIAQITGSGTLTVTSNPGAGYSSWITGTFAGGATVPGDKQGPNDDADNDGISNLIEYAIAGEDPTVPKASVGSFDGTTLSFTKRAGTSGLAYGIETSTNLVNWGTPGSGVNQDATSISYALTPGTPPKEFARLKVTGP